MILILAAKPKVASKKDDNLKEKNGKKEQSQVLSSKKKPGVQTRPPPSGKRQAVLDNKPLVKVPWSVSKQCHGFVIIIIFIE